MDFQFHEWEQLSANVTDGEAHARREMNGRGWLFRRCGRLMFVRDAEQAPLEWNRWLFLPPLCDGGWTNAPEMWNWDQLSYMTKRKNIWRVWRLSNDEPTTALWNEEVGWLITPDFGEFACGRQYQCPRAPFHFPSECDVKTTPSFLLLAPLLEQWHEVKSDLRFSAHFASLSSLQQNLSGVETRAGTSQEFASVFQLALRLFDFHWEDEIKSSAVALRIKGNKNRFFLEEQLPIGVHELAILNGIMRFYRPSLKHDSPSLPSAVRPFTDYGVSRSFCIKAAPVASVHEQLETVLMLRTWLETNWPDGVKHLAKVV